MVEESPSGADTADAPSFLYPRDTERGSCGIDWSIAELAGRQHGIVSRRQLLTFAGSGAIAARVRRGALHPIHRGVYAVGHEVLGVHGRWKAATLAVGAGAVLSHRSASHLWGLLPRAAIVPEVTIPRGWRGQAGICVHRSALPPDETDRLDGIPVTTVPRTILDLAAFASARQLERALNEVEVQGLTDRLSIPGSARALSATAWNRCASSFAESRRDGSRSHPQ
jgi:predicted transcriptional regulator of viral defense system